MSPETSLLFWLWLSWLIAMELYFSLVHEDPE